MTRVFGWCAALAAAIALSGCAQPAGSPQGASTGTASTPAATSAAPGPSASSGALPSTGGSPSPSGSTAPGSPSGSSTPSGSGGHSGSPTTTATATATSTPGPSPTSLRPDLRGRIISLLPRSGASSGKVVALTFDGGADARGAASILATLRARRVPASFFVTGAFAQANRAVVRDAAAIGPVGNHTWNHPQSPTLTNAALTDQLTRTATLIRAITGASPKPLFRFPFGSWDARTLGVVNGQGYAAVGWSVDSLGWKGTTGGMTAASVAARVAAAAKPGAVVLMHLGAHPDGSTLDADALPTIIDRYQGAGYRFVTLDVLR